MNASIRGQGDEVRFVVEDADAATAALLSAQFYAEADGRFEKRFRRHDLLFPHDFQAIEASWVRYLREARDRRVTPAAVDGALAWVADRHAEAGVDWWLAGSAALYVRGIDLLPHDIDVMSYLREADALAPVVEGSIVEPFQRVPEVTTHLRSNEACGRLDRVALIHEYVQRGEGDRGR